MTVGTLFTVSVSPFLFLQNEDGNKAYFRAVAKTRVVITCEMLRAVSDA